MSVQEMLYGEETSDFDVNLVRDIDNEQCFKNHVNYERRRG